jgi:aminoglycoside 6'-N-acetyltransferase
VAEAPILRGERVTLRQIEARDVGRLAEILGEPEVVRWWGDEDPTVGAKKLLEATDEVGFVIEAGGGVVGSIQYYEETDPMYRHAGMDIFLAAAHQNQGLGSEALRLLARHLFEGCGHHRLIIDPAVANERAIRTYERVGFRRVGVMRRYERGPDGAWRDGLLMDMLAGELRAPDVGAGSRR